MKLFIATNIKDLIAFLDKNGRGEIFAGGGIHYLYCYLEIIGAPINLTSSSWHSHYFGHSKNNDTTSL